MGPGWCSEIFSLRSRGWNFLTSNIREPNLFSVDSTTAWFELHGLLRTGSAAVVLTYESRTCIAAGQNPPGLGRDLGGLLARLVIPRFQQKAKQNRRAARFAPILHLFSHRG